jgi:CRISPR-associated endoribonuclease Cas6
MAILWFQALPGFVLSPRFFMPEVSKMGILHFRLYPLRLTFLARAPLSFPGTAGNRLRGAFGSILHKLGQAPVFEPSQSAGPSGLADLPRPFVFRANHLDGTLVAAGETFHFDFHWFDLRRPSLDVVIRAFRELAQEADLVDIRGADAPLQLCLNPSGEHVDRVTIRFETPTELKADGKAVERPEFGVLIARIRDRISTLRALYDDGPLNIDFREFAERAEHIRMTRCDIHHVESSRRSGRTGQVHPLGGFVGEADYEGDLAEFVPYLRAAHWTGVGRQTAWGKGTLSVGNCTFCGKQSALYTERPEV